MNRLSVDTRTSGEAVVVALAGELDLETAAAVERELARVEEEGADPLILDLSGLTFIDSTGLRVVISADTRARRGGRRLQLVQGPPSVHRVFRIALLDQRLEFLDGPPITESR